MKFKKIISAFTLIELLVAIVIIGMLSSMGISTYNGYIVDTKVSAIKKTVNDLHRFTILHARETDSFYNEIVLADILDKFGIKDLGYGDITYFALGKTDFYYQATLPNGETWTIALIPKVYAESSSFYASGTPKGIDFFKSLEDEERSNFIRAASDTYVLNQLRAKVIEKGFNSINVSSPWGQIMPDLDRDGVPDYRDDCPNIPGIEEIKGCPLVDTDGDGVTDDKDHCPKVAGDKYNYGCPLPDGDKDGIWDGDDKCPKESGKSYNKGCPVKKGGDKDGVDDRFDKCPKEAGVANEKFQGCPNKDDVDGDRILNKKDIYPEKAGKSYNKGVQLKEKEPMETKMVYGTKQINVRKRQE